VDLERAMEDYIHKITQCKLCGSPKNVEKHHIIPQALTRRQLELFGVKTGADILEQKKASETINLCHKCHLKVSRRVKEYLKIVCVAGISKCSCKPCLFEMKLGVYERNEDTCFTCRYYREGDLLNLYDWFAQDFGLPTIWQVAKPYQFDFSSLPDENGILHFEYNTIGCLFDDDFLEYLRTDP
jgi:hypothetical protein